MKLLVKSTWERVSYLATVSKYRPDPYCCLYIVTLMRVGIVLRGGNWFSDQWAQTTVGIKLLTVKSPLNILIHVHLFYSPLIIFHCIYLHYTCMCFSFALCTVWRLYGSLFCLLGVDRIRVLIGLDTLEFMLWRFPSLLRVLSVRSGRLAPSVGCRGESRECRRGRCQS